jgi:hypothetical protein
MTRFVPAALLCIAGLSTAAFSQGQYLKAGESGIGVTASMEFADEGTTFGVGPTYSYLGYVDVSVMYAHVSVETEGSPSIEFTGHNYGAQLAVHPLKQSESMPVGLAVNGMLLHSTYGGGDLEKNDIEGTANGFGLGGMLHRTFAIGEKFAILAGAGYGFAHIAVEIAGTKETEDSHSYPMTLEGIFNVGEKGKLVIGPEFTFNDVTNVFGVSAAYVMSL